MDLFELEAILRLNTTEFDKGVEDAEKSGTGFIDRIASTWTRAKSKFQTVSTVLRPVTDLIEDVVDKYATYQQQIGGIEKLFGNSAKTVADNARNAFRTAGMSMNDYMEMAVNMSASLIQGLAGDTEAAADLVDLAIQDMGDNVNTFGRSMEDVQNAYRGMARGTFTMLDNLSLGYSGSEQEMYRLMQDAAALNEEFAKSSVFYLDDKGSLVANYSDMIRAIHIIQENLGITGTTQKEAASTVSGSNATMKAALDNLKTIMGDPKATQDEIREASDNFAKSLSAWLDNIAPIITTAISSLIKVMSALMKSPEARSLIGELVKALSYAIVTAMAGLLDALVTGIAGIFDDTFKTGDSAFTRWGVYDWLDKTFGMGGFGGVQTYNREDLEAPEIGAKGEQAVVSESPQSNVSTWLAHPENLPQSAADIFGDKVGSTGEEAWWWAAVLQDTRNTDITSPQYAAKVAALQKAIEERNAHGFGAVSAIYGDAYFSALSGQDVYGELSQTEQQAIIALADAAQVLQNVAEMFGISVDDLNQATKQEEGLDAKGILTEVVRQLGYDNAEAIADAMMYQFYKVPDQFAQGTFTAGDVDVKDGQIYVGGATFYLTREGRVKDDVAGIVEGYSDAGNHAKGLWDVPYDDYYARLHRGEMVLTASEARDYREGSGSSDAVVAAIQRLSNEMQNLKIVVGQKVFGQTVVDYSGKRMNDYIGKAEDKMTSGYGWG